VMTIRELEIPAVKLIVPRRFSDARGYFSETWSEYLFRKEIANVTFVQDNQSMSVKSGTLRGLHFQKPPHAQGKLVRVLRGSIYDVAVDIRKGSPTYGKYVALTLDAVKERSCGCRRGFCTAFAHSRTKLRFSTKQPPTIARAMMRAFSGVIRTLILVGRSDPSSSCSPTRTNGIRGYAIFRNFLITNYECQILFRTQ